MKSQLNELKNILNKINKLEKISEFKSMIESGFKFTLLFFVITFDSLSNLCFDVQQNINKNTFVIDNYLKIKKIVEVFILIEEHKIQKIKDQDNQSEKQQYLQALSSNHTTKYEYTPPIKFFEKR